MQKTIPLLYYLTRLRPARMLLFTTALLFFSTAQAFSPQLYQALIPGAWVLDKTVDNVEFYHMITKCDGATVVLLKFNNKNGSAVNITWKEVFKTQLEQKRENVSGKKQIRLAAGETVASACGDTQHNALRILPGQAIPIYVADIRGFEYADIHVAKER